VICQNLYIGWYTQFGDLETTKKMVNDFLEKIHREHPDKPVIMTEFGAGAIAGLHSDPPEMWTEEYEAELIETYWKVFTSKEFVSGGHIWTFADFRTPQSYRRTVLNRKGMFTRIREPKLAAKVAKELFEKTPTYK